MEPIKMPENYTIKKLGQPEFDALQKTLSPQKVPIEQTPIWGSFDEALAGRTFLGSFRYDEGDRLVALASATLYQQRGRNWIWLKHGPIFAHVPNTEVIKKMCATLKAQFENSANPQPTFIRLTMPDRIGPLTLPFEHTMYDETVVVDLLKPLEQILSEMSQGGRRGIRKAEKAGIVVEEANTKRAVTNFEQLYYPLIRETASRDGFGAHPAVLYKTMLQTLQPYGRLYVATQKSQVLAWAITTEYDKSALYYYGASSATARELHAPYLLHWKIIQAMKERGNETYDFMGIAGKHYPALANVTQFKLKFSKDIVSVPVTYDLPLQPLKYKLLAGTIKARRKLSR